MGVVLSGGGIILGDEDKISDAFRWFFVVLCARCFLTVRSYIMIDHLN